MSDTNPMDDWLGSDEPPQETPQAEPAQEPAPQAEPEPQAEPASEPEGQPEPEGAKEKPDQVPLATFLEEKNQRRQLQQQMQALQQQSEQERSKWEERFNTLFQKFEPQIDPNENPVQYLDSKIEATNKTIEQLGKEFKESGERQQTQAVQQRIETMEQQFAAQHPDYFDALNHLAQARLDEVMAMGYDEDTAGQWVKYDQAALVHGALQAGKNPSHVAYELAQKRGWESKHPQNQQQAADKPANGDGQKRSSRLDKIAAGQQQATSLGSGGAPSPEVTAAKLLDMDDAEFDRLAGDEEAWRKLMGG